MKRLTMFVSLIVVVNTLPTNINIGEEWDAFKLKYLKSYKSQAEEQRRLKIFTENMEIVTEHNQLYESGEVSYRLAMNQFADLTNKEYAVMLSGRNPPKIAKMKIHSFKSMDLTKSVKFHTPKSVDWHRKGAVTAVKNQGHSCSSCWAFASIGALEGQHFLKTGQLISLSEQNLIDCSTSQGNQGCQYGWAFKAFQYIEDNRGIESELTYPYTGLNNQCKYNANYSVATDYGFIAIPSNDENKLREAIATVGPIAVQIDSSQTSFQHYAGGVYFDLNCSSVISNHAVLVVGYGTDRKGNDFYIVKNSWGEDWGENGYIRMIRNRNNSCGIATFGVYPIV